MERKTKDEKNLTKIKKLDNKNNRKYSSRGCMRKRIKNSKVISNVKEIGEDGLIYLKSGEVATLIEVKAIDLSLTSNQEKNLFFSMLKALYQIQNLNMKCYKLDEKLNLNANSLYSLPVFLDFLTLLANSEISSSSAQIFSCISVRVNWPPAECNAFKIGRSKYSTRSS